MSTKVCLTCLTVDPKFVQRGECTSCGSDAGTTVVLASVVEGGWWHREPLVGLAGGLLYFRDGGIALLHLCDRGKRGRVVCAPFLQTKTSPVRGPVGHTVTGGLGAVTVDPSVACGDCGLHGWVRSSEWVPA